VPGIRLGLYLFIYCAAINISNVVPYSVKVWHCSRSESCASSSTGSVLSEQQIVPKTLAPDLWAMSVTAPSSRDTSPGHKTQLRIRCVTYPSVSTSGSSITIVFTKFCSLLRRHGNRASKCRIHFLQLRALPAFGLASPQEVPSWIYDSQISFRAILFPDRALAPKISQKD
jgi:hypothetical protein